MTRRIWIVSGDTEITESVKTDARLANCSEVAKGIPPALTGKVQERELPIAYDEVETPEPVNYDLVKELDTLAKGLAELKSRVSSLESAKTP